MIQAGESLMINVLLLLPLPIHTSFQATFVYSAISITIEETRVPIRESLRFVDKSIEHQYITLTGVKTYTLLLGTNILLSGTFRSFITN
jgi:hypothetical protein